MIEAALFAVDPVGLGGVALRARAGASRDRWMARLGALLPADTRLRRVPLHVSEGRLLGGLDLAATLRAGRPVAERGILEQADGGVLLLAMAERMQAATVARIAAVLDSGEAVTQRDGVARRSPARIGIIAFDEGAEADERLAAPLLDRLAFHVSLDEDTEVETEFGDIEAARARLPRVTASDEIVETLCVTASALGIASLRAPLLALRVARVAAALAGRTLVSTEDAGLAARLVLAPRATTLPASPDKERAEPEPPGDGETAPDREPDPAPEDTDAKGSDAGPVADIVLAAAAASIPAGLLTRLRDGGEPARSSGAAGRMGAPVSAALRGRPAGVRAGDPRGGLRLNLIETLRAAAPWQGLRHVPGTEGPAIRVRREDFRVTRLKRILETTTIFLVDASGSQAVNRLAEAKGAVELLLADCYVRRDQVAVLAFRGRAAQMLLPPTRSLARAKRSLAGLPGGGGTPLAAGIDAGPRPSRCGASPWWAAGDRAADRWAAERGPGWQGRASRRRGRCHRCRAPGAGGGSRGAVGRYLAAPAPRQPGACRRDGRAVRAAAFRRGRRPGTLGAGGGALSDRRLDGWPNRHASRFVRAGGLNWHVQTMGQGPVLLLAHGTGAATHSWRGLAPLLAEHFTVVAPDLPAHGFTNAPAAARLSLPGMARSLRSLLLTLDIAPAMAAGHSAGAAILMRMCLDGQIAPQALVSLNGALLPMGGAAGQMFSPLAKLLTGLPILPALFSWRAGNPRVVENLLAADRIASRRRGGRLLRAAAA